MRIFRKLEVELYGLEGILPGANEFLAKYSPYQLGKTTCFVFQDEPTIIDAFNDLSKLKLKAEHFYTFKLNLNEISSYPAIYLGITTIENLIITDKIDEERFRVCDIGKDYESEKIVISQQAKAILKEMTQQIEWIDAKGSTGHDFSVMKVIRILQDPIIIPSPSFMGMNETPHGTYAIRSDGRDVISTKNINIIKEVGIALSLNAKVNQKVLRWRPRLIISGAAYYALASAGIKCLLEPISPLIPENHPLSQPNENEYSSRNL